MPPAPFAHNQLRPTKLHAYEPLRTLNRCFEATLLSLERLDHLGLFRQEVNACRVTLEYTRSQANDELIHTLQNLEQEDTARFERMHDEWEKQNRDPDDVFFHAQERRQEIREQIKTERGLSRESRGRKKRRKRLNVNVARRRISLLGPSRPLRENSRRRLKPAKSAVTLTAL